MRSSLIQAIAALSGLALQGPAGGSKKKKRSPISPLLLGLGHEQNTLLPQSRRSRGGLTPHDREMVARSKRNRGYI